MPKQTAEGITQIQESIWVVYIPENNYGLEKGYYTKGELVRILQANSHTEPLIHFIADMME